MEPTRTISRPQRLGPNLVAGWKINPVASNRDGAVQLFTVRANGKGLHKVSNLPAIRGRSDWSPNENIL